MEMSAELLALNSSEFAEALRDHRDQELAVYKDKIGTSSADIVRKENLEDVRLPNA